MDTNHIPLIMERLDKIASEERAKKFLNMVIVKILVIQKIYGVSYRPSRNYDIIDLKLFMFSLSPSAVARK